MSWLEQSEKCSDKYVLAWPVDYGNVRATWSSRNNIRPMGAKIQSQNMDLAGEQFRVQEVQEVSKTC